MQLPLELKLEIDKQISNISLNLLKKHAAELSSRYREGGEQLISHSQKLAYISVRMPATYATIIQTFMQLKHRLPHLAVESLLDLGAGPGTGLWAAEEIFPESLVRATLIEKDPSFVQLGQQLLAAKSWEGVDIQWKVADLVQTPMLPLHDLVLASFSLGELNWQKIILSMWDATKKSLVIIEPGTPQGFERIKIMRKILLEQGAHLIAPCPHSQECPMQGSDWCHFAARIERSSAHRHMKNGSMNYEDEKFCYLIFSREIAPAVQSRILSRPQKNSGYVNLKLCSKEGVNNTTISRKLKDEYRQVRKLEWGDIY